MLPFWIKWIQLCYFNNDNDNDDENIAGNILQSEFTLTRTYLHSNIGGVKWNALSTIRLLQCDVLAASEYF